MYLLKKKFKIFLQFDSNDCGPACLKSIFEHYGYNIPFNLIKEKCLLSHQGTTLNTLKTVCQDLYFDSIIVHCGFNDILSKPILPSVFVINTHFVVVYKITPHMIYVADPAIGKIRYSLSQFKNLWEDSSGKGFAILIRPKQDINTKKIEAMKLKWRKKENSLYKDIKHYLKNEYDAFLIICFCLLITSGLQFLFPFFMQLIIDEGIKYNNKDLIFLLCFGQLSLVISKLIIELFRKWILIYLTTIFNVSLIYKFLLKIIQIPLSYFEFRSYGDLLQRIEDHKKIDRLINYSTINSLFSFLTFLFYSLLLLTYNISIFWILITFMLVYMSYNLFFTKQRKIIDYKSFQESSANRDSIFQMIFGIKEIKLFQAEKFMINKWESIQKQIFKLNINSQTISNYQTVGATFLNEIKNCGILILCCHLVTSGQMTLGIMFTVLFIIGMLNTPINDVIVFINELIDANMANNRINDIYEIESEEPSKGTEDIYKRLKSIINKKQTHFNEKTNDELINIDNVNSIKIENLCFSYQKSLTGEKSSSTIEGVSFEIARGKKVAIVGSSGSGKTTILKLLLGFYTTEQESIYIDSTPLSTFSIKKWRSICSTVLQDGYLFSDTIANNIALGSGNIDINKLKKSATMAEIHDLIESFPLKFNTKIGNNGVGISQGQKQRLLIARAIYKDSPFFFFDEATSSLDSLNESKIMNNIYKNLNEKGVLIIAHRLSTIINADEIIVLDKGRIVERGTHYNLLNTEGYYYQLIKNQIEV